MVSALQTALRAHPRSAHSASLCCHLTKIPSSAATSSHSNQHQIMHVSEPLIHGLLDLGRAGCADRLRELPFVCRSTSECLLVYSSAHVDGINCVTDRANASETSTNLSLPLKIFPSSSCRQPAALVMLSSHTRHQKAVPEKTCLTVTCRHRRPAVQDLLSVTETTS